MQPSHLISRRGFVVALLISALTVSLATRVSHGSFATKIEVSSSSDYQKVQHRDKDAVEWSPSSAELCPMWVMEASVSAEQHHAVYGRPQYDSLYNRPPPVE